MHAGVHCFEDEHQWPASWLAKVAGDDELMEAVDGIEGDFAGCRANAAGLAARLVAVLESVAAGDCLGCRNVACRIAMLIEDLEAEAAHEKTIKEF